MEEQKAGLRAKGVYVSFPHSPVPFGDCDIVSTVKYDADFIRLLTDMRQ